MYEELDISQQPFIKVCEALQLHYCRYTTLVPLVVFMRARDTAAQTFLNGSVIVSLTHCHGCRLYEHPAFRPPPATCGKEKRRINQ